MFAHVDDPGRSRTIAVPTTKGRGHHEPRVRYLTFRLKRRRWRRRGVPRVPREQTALLDGLSMRGSETVCAQASAASPRRAFLCLCVFVASVASCATTPGAGACLSRHKLCGPDFNPELKRLVLHSDHATAYLCGPRPATFRSPTYDMCVWRQPWRHNLRNSLGSQIGRERPTTGRELQGEKDYTTT